MVRPQWLLVLVVLAAGMLAGPASAAPKPTTKEGEAALKSQIDAGKVRAATVYTHRHVIHASLAGGHRYTVHYPAAARKTIVASLLSHHVRFKIVKGATKSHGLRLRYIALIVVAAIVLAAGLLIVLRRRRRDRHAAPAAPAA